jgi:hypothetical protein
MADSGDHWQATLTLIRQNLQSNLHLSLSWDNSNIYTPTNTTCFSDTTHAGHGCIFGACYYLAAQYYFDLLVLFEILRNQIDTMSAFVVLAPRACAALQTWTIWPLFQIPHPPPRLHLRALHKSQHGTD